IVSNRCRHGFRAIAIVSKGDGDARSLGAEQLRGGTPDSTRAACHECGTPRQSEIHMSGTFMRTETNDVPPARMVLSFYTQYWISSAVLAAANLGIADVVDSTPRHVQAIARDLDANEDCV